MKRIKILSLLLLVLAFLNACQDANTGGNPGSPTPSPTATPVPTTLRFFTFGDWGTSTPSQFAVASAVTSDCQAKGCDFGLLLGDNFYPNGVASVTDPQWQDKFENVYGALPGPFYVVLGNHDYDGNEQAQIDYTATQSRWKLPARAYSIRQPEAAAEPLLEIFVIDSNAFDAAAANALQSALNASTATWKLLAMHHPLYSNGLHGDNSAGSNPLLLPVICEKIDAVLSGHDHLFSHIDNPSDGCNFPQFVIGTGGRDLYTANFDPRAIFTESSFGYGIFEIDPGSLRLEFRRSDGSLAHAFQMTK